MTIPADIQLKTNETDRALAEEILSPQALEFIKQIHRRFNGRRKTLLDERQGLQHLLNQGEILDFPSDIPGDGWTVAPIPADLKDRRVEITGPVDKKMVINALNCGAKIFMGCFEDACSPTFANLLQGQKNIRDAVLRTLEFVDEKTQKLYRLNSEVAVLKVRPRGLHLEEKHVLIDGEPISGAFFDFAVFFYLNARTLLAQGSGPYVYLPKLEHHLEAALWNDVFVYAQQALSIPHGSIRATVLIETLPACFHAEGILYQLRDHIDGLNCGRWDYIFSYIKKHQNDPRKILPDRAAVAMTVPFMRAYCLHVIRTCHRHGAYAMGGMAAQIPIKNNPSANEEAFFKVKTDKEREVKDGHDGTWVAHPGLVPVAMEVFNQFMPTANQIDRIPPNPITASQLLDPCPGPKTVQGVLNNVQVGVDYLAAWLGGMGAVPLNNLMEDAATAEISRVQIWQWHKHQVTLDSGELVDEPFLENIFTQVKERIDQRDDHPLFTHRHSILALELMEDLTFDANLADFLTIPAYQEFF